MLGYIYAVAAWNLIWLVMFMRYEQHPWYGLLTFLEQFNPFGRDTEAPWWIPAMFLGYDLSAIAMAIYLYMQP